MEPSREKGSQKLETPPFRRGHPPDKWGEHLKNPPRKWGKKTSRCTPKTPLKEYGPGPPNWPKKCPVNPRNEELSVTKERKILSQTPKFSPNKKR